MCARPEIVRRNAERNLERLADFGLHDDSRILDFGAGSGAFVSAAGERCYGIELGAPTQSRIFADVGPATAESIRFHYVVGRARAS